MRRRDFIVGLGGAAAWPVVVSAANPRHAHGWCHHECCRERQQTEAVGC
jgi:hypothetical protein